MREAQLSAASREALEVLGASIRVGRIRRRWSLAELAERVGVSRPTIAKVERGDPSVAVGTVFEAATLLGVVLYDTPEDRRRQQAMKSIELALLPSRARQRVVEVDDDF